MDEKSSAIGIREMSSAPPTARRTRRLLAALASSVFPGAGQLWLGKTRMGLAFICGGCILVILYWPLRLPKSYIGLMLLLFLAMFLCTISTWHALRTPTQQTGKGSRWLLILIIPIALLASFVHTNWLLFTAGFRTFGIPSSGMAPTVVKGDRLIVDLKSYRHLEPASREVVVIHKENVFYIKRVIAVGGDTIESKDGNIFVNGQRLHEPYIQHTGDAPPELNNFGPFQIPSAELFVMGDNRDISIDRRMAEFGLVPEATVTGKVLYLITPSSQHTGTEIR